jgi:D-alanyl-D-alanine carboxypeptidase
MNRKINEEFLPGKMAIMKACIFACILLSLLTGLKAAATAPDTLSLNPYGQDYQSILDKYVKQGLTGAVLLVRTREEGTWIGTAGYSRLEDHTPMQPDSVFFALSSTKSYTATAILMLRDRGLIDLDANIDLCLSRDITDRIANGHTATVRHLLTHTAGIPDWERHVNFIDPWNNPCGVTWRDYLEVVYDKPALFAPGTGREYANVNYLLLALIIDSLVGDHAQFFSTNIFQPLGLHHTFYKLESELPWPPGLVNIYFDRFGDGVIENITDVISVAYFNVDRGYSGILADLTDMANFMEALAGDKLLSQEAWGEMTKPSYAGFEWYGLGIGIFQIIDKMGIDHSFYEMAGSGLEGLTQTRTSPQAGVTVSLATNIATRNRPLSQKLFMKILDEATEFAMKQRGRIPEEDGNNKGFLKGEIIEEQKFK